MTQAAESSRFDARRFMFDKEHEVRAAARGENGGKTSGATIRRRLEGCTDVPGWSVSGVATCSFYEENYAEVSWLLALPSSKFFIILTPPPHLGCLSQGCLGQEGLYIY